MEHRCSTGLRGLKGLFYRRAITVVALEYGCHSNLLLASQKSLDARVLLVFVSHVDELRLGLRKLIVHNTLAVELFLMAERLLLSGDLLKLQLLLQISYLLCL